MRILLVEDDVSLAESVAMGVREQHIDVDQADSFASGRMRAVLGTHDVIVLDVMLPGGTGIELCRELRRRGIGTPILLLTARDAIDDRVLGLGAGADDYLTKPFAFQELLARIRALARRRPAITPKIIEIADLVVDLDSRRVRRKGATIMLTAREFSLLEAFALHVGKVLGRSELAAHVWDDNHDPFSNLLDVLVSRLRRKLDDGHTIKLIHTLRGAGYRFGL